MAMPSQPSRASSWWKPAGKPPSRSRSSQYSSPKRVHRFAMASRMRSCSAENEKSIFHQCGDFRIVEAKLDQNFPRVLAKAQHAAADLAPATPVRPDRKLGEAAFRRLSLLQMGELRGPPGLRQRSNGTSFSSRSLIQSSALLLRITSASL